MHGSMEQLRSYIDALARGGTLMMTCGCVQEGRPPFMLRQERVQWLQGVKKVRSNENLCYLCAGRLTAGSKQ